LVDLHFRFKCIHQAAESVAFSALVKCVVSLRSRFGRDRNPAAELIPAHPHASVKRPAICVPKDFDLVVDPAELRPFIGHLTAEIAKEETRFFGGEERWGAEEAEVVMGSAFVSSMGHFTAG
jgi:hypothetical protein